VEGPNWTSDGIPASIFIRDEASHRRELDLTVGDGKEIEVVMSANVVSGQQYFPCDRASALIYMKRGYQIEDSRSCEVRSLSV
jgi:hypothetical protein